MIHSSVHCLLDEWIRDLLTRNFRDTHILSSIVLLEIMIIIVDGMRLMSNAMLL